MARDMAERATIARRVTEIGQTALLALETAEALADPADRERARSAAERAVLDIIRLVREFAGLPVKAQTTDGRK